VRRLRGVATGLVVQLRTRRCGLGSTRRGGRRNGRRRPRNPDHRVTSWGAREDTPRSRAGEVKVLASLPLLGVVLVAGAVLACGPATAAPLCGRNLASEDVVDAVRSLPTYPGTDRAWDADSRTFEGNFDPCATLSTALVTVEGATGSSPTTALMFHSGTYLGRRRPRRTASRRSTTRGPPTTPWC
jgi:hypothetical protein